MTPKPEPVDPPIAWPEPADTEGTEGLPPEEQPDLDDGRGIVPPYMNDEDN